jgi:hypothetical protein
MRRCTDQAGDDARGQDFLTIIHGSPLGFMCVAAAA